MSWLRPAHKLRFIVPATAGDAALPAVAAAAAASFIIATATLQLNLMILRRLYKIVSADFQINKSKHCSGRRADYTERN